MHNTYWVQYSVLMSSVPKGFSIRKKHNGFLVINFLLENFVHKKSFPLKESQHLPKIVPCCTSERKCYQAEKKIANKARMASTKQKNTISTGRTEKNV